MKSCKASTITSWVFQLIAAAILAQTLFFKFSGAEESKYIFATLGAEPWGRVATGCAELVAVALLLTPRFVTLGALLSLGLMTGAIGSHLTKLGLVVKDDGGLLFVLALTVFVSSAAILVLRRRQIPILGGFFVPMHELRCEAEDCCH
jgi:phosphate/sulfate permease